MIHNGKIKVIKEIDAIDFKTIEEVTVIKAIKVKYGMQSVIAEKDCTDMSFEDTINEIAQMLTDNPEADYVIKEQRYKEPLPFR